MLEQQRDQTSLYIKGVSASDFSLVIPPFGPIAYEPTRAHYDEVVRFRRVDL